MSQRLSSSAIVTLVFALAWVAPALAGERAVDLSAADGTRLKATYFAAGRPGPGVLLLHQCNRDRKVWEGLAQKLMASGINVLTIDNRGFGESGGTPHDKLEMEPEMKVEMDKWPGDFDTAFQYLVSQPGVTRDMIGVGGASCGVNNSIQTARRHPEVRSLVLLSGNTDLNGRQFLRNSAKLPVFFAVADDDEFPPTVQWIEWLYSLTSNPGKKLDHYAKGGHGADMFSAHPDLPGKIVDWYVTTLIKTPGQAPVSRDAPAIPQEVRDLDMIDHPGGATKIQQKLEDARRGNRTITLFSEMMVNMMGYEHLQAGEAKTAIEILKLNIAQYPHSPNVYDSLSDAYLADGRKDLARKYAKRALEMLPMDTTDDQKFRERIRASAEGKLKKLGDAPN